MRAKCKVQPYAGGIVVTILTEDESRQLGQSSMHREDDVLTAMNGAVNHFIRNLLGEERAASWLPEELDLLGRAKKAEWRIAQTKSLILSFRNRAQLLTAAEVIRQVSEVLDDGASAHYALDPLEVP